MEIKHKYLHTLHDIMESFNVRFPEELGLHRLTIRDFGLFTSLEQVKTYSERSQELIKLYTEKKVPLAFIAAMTDTEVIKFALAVTQVGGEIVACYGNAAERLSSETLIATMRAKAQFWIAIRRGSRKVSESFQQLKNSLGISIFLDQRLMKLQSWSKNLISPVRR